MNIAILSKAPFAGYAKTRLIPLLGAEGAVAVHRQLVTQTLKTCLEADIGPCTLWVTDPHPFFIKHTRGTTIQVLPQPEGHLGKRMATAFKACNTPTLLVGTDCPALTPSILKTCRAQLKQTDLLTCPAEDGGFVLIGASKPDQTPFNILFDDVAWGTNQALAHLEKHVDELCLSYQRGPTLWDIDEPTDYERWAQ